jgi:hypothetical protein
MFVEPSSWPTASVLPCTGPGIGPGIARRAGALTLKEARESVGRAMVRDKLRHRRGRITSSALAGCAGRSDNSVSLGIRDFSPIRRWPDMLTLAARRRHRAQLTLAEWVAAEIVIGPADRTSERFTNIQGVPLNPGTRGAGKKSAIRCKPLQQLYLSRRCRLYDLS